MKKFILVCALFAITSTSQAQFWRGFLQGTLQATDYKLRQLQIRQQQERARQQREEANRVEKKLRIETGFKWYEVTKGEKVGAEDYNGNTLIPISRGYDMIIFMEKDGHLGYFAVWKNEKEGACDITGREIIAPIYNYVFYSDGFKYDSGSSYHPLGWYLDSNGKATREVPIKKELKTENNGFKWYKVSQGKKIGAEDYYNNTLIPLSKGFDQIFFRSEEGCVGYFSVEKNGKEGAYDIKGKEIAAPIYESVTYSDGFISRVSELNVIRIGWLLDEDGKAYRGTKEKVYNGNIAFFIESKDGRYGLTDSIGKFIVNMELDALETAGKGYLRFKSNGYWGIMNFQGKIIIPVSRHYTTIGDFVSSRKRFPYEMAGYKGECNHLGQQISKTRIPASQSNPSPSAKASSSAGSSSNKSNANDPGLKYAGTYTQSPQGYCQETGEYTDGIGAGFEKDVKIYDDHIVVMGSECKFQSKSGKWKIYSDPAAFGGTRNYYYVDDNFNMKYVSVMDNPFTGGVNTFTYAMEKGSVTFSIQQNQNVGGSVGGASTNGTSTSGGTYSTSSPTTSKHALCHGTGKCNTCNGSGQAWIGMNKQQCPNCKGSGKCAFCNGTGRGSAHYY